jgi:hypothetical protein
LKPLTGLIAAFGGDQLIFTPFDYVNTLRSGRSPGPADKIARIVSKPAPCLTTELKKSHLVLAKVRFVSIL